MKKPLSLLFLSFFLFPSAPAKADLLSQALRKVNACSCNSGHGLHEPSSCGGSYSRNVQRMFDENPGQMISCCRPRAVQDYLIRCYNACGQPGRAAKNSKHITGRACDTTNGSIGKRYGLSYIPHHGSNHFQD